MHFAFCLYTENVHLLFSNIINMKKILFSLLIVAGLASCKDGDKNANATNEPTTNTEAQAPANNLPNLTTIQWLDSTFSDLGTIKEGKVVEISYKFKNVGEHPLVFSNVSASCGCTVPKKPEAPIAPGEEGEIVAQFDSKNQKGNNRKRVNVIANTDPASFALEFSVTVE